MSQFYLQSSGVTPPPPTTPITFTNIGGLTMNGLNSANVALGGTLLTGFGYNGVSGATAAVSNNGYIFTAGGTLTLPAAPASSDKISIITIATGVVIQASPGQIIRIAAQNSSSGGTATNTQVGDTLELIFGSGTWFEQNSNGGWNLA